MVQVGFLSCKDPAFIGVGGELLSAVLTQEEGRQLLPQYAGHVVASLLCPFLTRCLPLTIYGKSLAICSAFQFIYYCELVCTSVEVREQLEELPLPFHHIGSGDQAQVTRLSGKHLDPMSHLAGPPFVQS